MNKDIHKSGLRNKTDKFVPKTPSLQRRRSLKSLKAAKFRIGLKQNTYIGDRIMIHRGVMNFDNFEFGWGSRLCSIEDRTNNEELTVANLIDNTMRPSGKRILKLTVHHQSPTCDEKLHKLITSRHVKKKVNRQISIHPEKILDAPEVSLQFHNIMDWSKQNIIAVSLGAAVYLWDASAGIVEELMNFDVQSQSSISCVKWFSNTHFKSDHLLALGSNDGNLMLWDSKRKKEIRKVKSSNQFNESAIVSIAVRNNLVSVGRSCGLIEHHDIRLDSAVLVNKHHHQTIRHLKWSVNFQYLAVVTQGDCLSIWSENKLDSSPHALFKEKMNDLAWNYKDRNIFICCSADIKGVLKIFDVFQKICVKSITTDSFISCVLWSDIFDEVAISSEDNENFRIKILHEDNLSSMVELKGHHKSIIAMVTNPTGEVVATIGEDEQIRLWNCFQCPDAKKLKSSRNQKSSFLKDLERFR